MLVETYEVTELTADLKPECDAEALALIESLNLNGQMDLATRSDDGAAKRNPYRHMTREEALVYGLLLPKKTKIADYADGMIPLRVLQVAAHAKEHFTELWVWSPASAADKDPLLVGMTKQPIPGMPSHYTRDTEWLLARWGDVLLPFPELIKQAAVRAREKINLAIRRAKGEIEKDEKLVPHLSDLQALVASSGGIHYHEMSTER